MPNNKYNRRYTPYDTYFDKFSFLDNPDYWTDSSSEYGKRKASEQEIQSSSSSSSSSSSGTNSLPNEPVNEQPADEDSITTEEGELTSDSSEPDDPNDSDYVPSDDEQPEPVPEWPMDNLELMEFRPDIKVQPDMPMMLECFTGPDGRFFWILEYERPYFYIAYERSPRTNETWIFNFEFPPFNRLLSATDINDTTSSITCEDFDTIVAGTSLLVTHKPSSTNVIHKIRLNFFPQNSTRMVLLNDVQNSEGSYFRSIVLPNYDVPRSSLTLWEQNFIDIEHAPVNMLGADASGENYLAIGVGYDLWNTPNRRFGFYVNNYITIKTGFCDTVWNEETRGPFDDAAQTMETFEYKGVLHIVVETKNTPILPEYIPNVYGLNMFDYALGTAIKIQSQSLLKGFHVNVAKPVLNATELSDTRYQYFNMDYLDLMDYIDENGQQPGFDNFY